MRVDEVRELYAAAEKLAWSPFPAIGAGVTQVAGAGVRAMAAHPGAVGKAAVAAPVVAGGVALAKSTPEQRQRMGARIQSVMPTKQAGVPGLGAALTSDATRALSGVGKAVSQGARSLAYGARSVMPETAKAFAPQIRTGLNAMHRNPLTTGAVAAGALGTGGGLLAIGGGMAARRTQ